MNTLNTISRALHADNFTIWTATEQLKTAEHRLQEALDAVVNWRGGVQLNIPKTVVTCFSLSNQPENFKLHIQGKEVTHEEHYRTYLGVKLDKRLTWTL